jgi:cyclophilin family peptidyl-prolyl cis-trans isomerase/HEAT repeat protein
MRKLAAAVFLLGIACTTVAPPQAPAPGAGEEYGLTIQEEARVLAMEDRRALDPSIVTAFVQHPNVLHRQRIALALGRIGPHDFVDVNGDGDFDPADERKGGVAELTALTADPDRRVREAVAFSLGEIADPASTETLFRLAADADAAVAAEAVEALAKLATDRHWADRHLRRYLWFTSEQYPEGIRGRAIRYLFRFDSDDASEAALAALASPLTPIRQEAAYALSRRGYAKARPQLELLLTDPNILTRAYAAAGLGRIADPLSLPSLVSALGDVHPWVRTNAALAAAKVAEKDASVLRVDDLPRVFAAVEDADPGVRISAIEFLGAFVPVNESARARLFEITKNGTQQERDYAAIALARRLRFLASGDLSAAQFLALTEAQRYERYRSVYFDKLVPVTSWWGQAEMVRATANIYWGALGVGSRPDARIRAAAIAAYPQNYAERVPELLRKFIAEDPDVIVRAAAIERYMKLENEDPDLWMKTLDEAERRERSSEMNDARLAAITALAEAGVQREELFLQLLQDPDPVVRRHAADLRVSKFGAQRPKITPLPVRLTDADYEAIVRWSKEPHTATIHMPRGKIEIALLVQDAPVTTWNFAQLAKAKYFDGTSFMRVVPNFVIQGGDPRNDMNGGPGYAIRDEINLQKYTRGAVGMALSGPDTGGSQFFVTHSPQPHLDGGYTIFGRVYDGMSGVVDQVERGDRVDTITIDEHSPVAAEQIGSIRNVSLPLVVGKITSEELVAAVPTYAERRAQYQPDVAVVDMLRSYIRPGDRIEVYMGTWCDDSEREVPKLLRIADELQSQFGVTLPIELLAIDRSKQQPASLLAGHSIEKVATFIYYRDDREVGRIAERPTSLFEDDLLEIAAREARP